MPRWVDGSLRDFDWYAPKIASCGSSSRTTASRCSTSARPEATVGGASRRAARGGGGEESRYIPEDVLAASLAAPALTLRALTPHVDFVARITNESNDDPELEALEAVDSSGDWGAISRRFGGSYIVIDGGGVGAVAGIIRRRRPRGDAAAAAAGFSARGVSR